MNEVKVFCPNCQEGVIPRDLTETYTVGERFLHVVLAFVAFYAVALSILACVFIVGFFLVVPMFRWFKRECMIVLTGKKSSTIVCSECNVIL